MTNHNPARHPWMVLLALLASGALLLAASPSATAGEHEVEEGLGDLLVLDDLEDEEHQPVVTCEFWIEGRDMPADNGTLGVERTIDNVTVLNDTWMVEEGRDGFINGPYELPVGNYTVRAFYHYEGLEEPNGTRMAAEPVRFTVAPCPEPEPEPDPTCPSKLEAEALGNGDVRLTFEPAEGSDGSRVYRSVGDEDPVMVAELDGNATGFVDTTTVPGTTYTYEVRAVFGEVESKDCPTVEVTAIPVFPTVVGALAASTVGVLAYAGARRRV